MADRSNGTASSLVSAARGLAEHHQVSWAKADPIPAWKELGRTADWLHAARLASADPPPQAGKAAEWLLDNDYQVHRAIRQIGQDLPASFYARLPTLVHDGRPAYPRIFVIAHELLRLTRMQISLAAAVRFFRAYQQRRPLTIAELWALPTMLRIACLETVVDALTAMLPDRIRLPFAPTPWAADAHNLDDTGRVARGIANLALIAAIPWDEFFDQTSLVEEILADDPSGFYADMDFETRDRYRRAVEELAEFGSGDELAVAREAVRLAGGSAEGSVGRHVGFWLVDAGKSELASLARVRFPFRRRAAAWTLAHPGMVYGLALAMCTLGAMILPAAYLFLVNADTAGWIVGLALTIVPASILAVTMVNWTITRTVSPRTLAKLDCSKALPRDCATAVVLPVIVADETDVARLIEQTETHWLANSDPRLVVALLVDLADADAESMPVDAAIVAALQAGVTDLNKRHGKRRPGPFHLLVRPRRFNPAEGCWMAWERKRGKLEQFNRLLIDGDAAAFSLWLGHRPGLAGIRFVVTADADTMLPPGSVGRLVGTLAHPLNRARVDETGRIIGGYSIIQPRTEISPQSGMRTLFTRLFTGDTAIDIYSRAVSDVYQDLFGAGIFVGKGIYDLRAFHRSVDGRVPENSILSHDLFEGAHGRVGLATDIVLYEGFPATYLEYARRLHRWIRGDWQLLPWLRRRVPAADGTRLEPCFEGIDRWKILDNLRRSLVAPTMLALAVAGWLVLPGAPWFWTLLAVLAPAGQLFADLVSGLARGRRRGAVRGLVRTMSDQAGRWLLAIAYLLHEAMLSLHAIGLTLWRLAVTRRRLLEWTSAAQIASSWAARNTRAAIWRQMWTGPVVALLVGLLVAMIRPLALPAAVPLLLLWIVAPEVTVRIGRRRRIEAEPLEADDARFLRGMARRTWFYFEACAGPEDNWLPPDNYQSEPHEETAHRTSPTNIGMLLLSAATAWDLGYIGRRELAARTENLFDSLDRLERHRGHLFNWYETRFLKPLEPRYVSAVDSGNLAGSLIAFAAALRDAGASHGLEPQRWSGLEDVIRLLEEAAAGAGFADLAAAVEALRDRSAELRGRPDSWLFVLSGICDEDLPAIERLAAEAADSAPAADARRIRELYWWLDRLRHQAASMLRDLGEAAGIGLSLQRLARRAAAMADAMDFTHLYDRERKLFYIGHNVSLGRTDPHHYDLLASEARLASLFAIAKGDVPVEHWFHLERPVTRADGGLALLSWNGSMFEYLMPRLLLRSGPESLLGESERIAVLIQRRYGDANGLPWGISESAYAARDPDHRYRYQAFGVPGLGLRRGLARDMVVTPYASALALAVVPRAAAGNLGRLHRLGAVGAYGFMEAVDFTPERRGEADFSPVDAYMAHHQGMILSAIGNALSGDLLVRRFASDPRVRLVSLLLSERIPREIPSEIERLEELEREPIATSAPTIAPAWQPAAAADHPSVQLLGNGRLASWTSEGGGGALRWRGQALTRFVADATRDDQGTWLYLADLDDGSLWSATRQPTAAVADEYRVSFHAHMAEYFRRDRDIEARLEVCVAAGDDLEIRRLSLSNESARPRRLRLTSYAEVVLAPPLEDERHPAFSKLFVATEFVPELGGLLVRRRPRSPRETPPVLLHFVVDADGGASGVAYECDRRTFVGRGGDLRAPDGAMSKLGNGAGHTLDPIVSLQLDIELRPYERREICFVTAAAATSETAVEIAERHASLAALEWALGDAASEAARAVERAGVDANGLPALQALASQLVYPHGPLRADPAAIASNRLGQPDLWGLALSGDVPILLLRAGGGAGSLLGELVAAHQYWRRAGLEADLVVLQTGGSAYVEPIREDITELLRVRGATELLGRKGGIHLLFADQIGPEHVQLIEAAAHAVLDASADLPEQLARAANRAPELPQFGPSQPRDRELPTEPLARPTDLQFDNGTGGFSADGREYVIHLAAGATTPAPWSNILANDAFGTLVTEVGGGFTWAENSGENRLTPWTNDPVIDRAVETLYLRDEETAGVWSVAPAPAGRDAACEIRHGAGYTVWRRRSHEVEQEMLAFVPRDGAVKIVRLRLRNLARRHRRLTATCYVEWLIGALPSAARHHVVCGYDAALHAILASSCWNPDFAGRIAFFAASRPPHGFTTDRREFIGREPDPGRPAGLTRWGLSGRVQPGIDPCGAYQVHHDLAPEGSDEIVFVLGQGRDEADAAELVRKWTSAARVEEALEALNREWDERLGSVQVRTPDPGFDLMVNRWLLYQAYAARLLGRTGFYQSSGAFGFRDQLQDVLALLHGEPARARAHILACAAHQFEEGDVLHWWHPPVGRGVRTRCSDDLAWLVYATASYVQATGDESILAEEVAFLQAPPLAAEEADRYARFDRSGAPRPLIVHLERALERAFTQGAHGLPLIGSGDWNDGMDRLGEAGRGESVWLAWFLVVCAELLSDMERRLGRGPAADRWADRARELRSRVEESGWDGDWYRRAYDDDGNPVGSAKSSECRIDSISQSWALFAGANERRVRAALAAAQCELIDTDARIVRLLWPPFDAGPHDPGYIKAYPPGVRENGGQYSHAAAWLGLAFAASGDPAAAESVFASIVPLARSADTRLAADYRVEPYVVAGDISAAGPHRGRGGWTWYTGAAAWTWRLAVEGLLGIRLCEGRIVVDPCIPRHWGGYEAVIRRPQGMISLRVEDPDGIGAGSHELTVDGELRTDGAIAAAAAGPVEAKLRLMPGAVSAGARRGVAATGAGGAG